MLQLFFTLLLWYYVVMKGPSYIAIFALTNWNNIIKWSFIFILYLVTHDPHYNYSFGFLKLYLTGFGKEFYESCHQPLWNSSYPGCSRLSVPTYRNYGTCNELKFFPFCEILLPSEMAIPAPAWRFITS